MALDFPANPAAQTPTNTFSPTSTPEANTSNSLTYIWDGTKWNTDGTIGVYVAKSGDTMTGALNVPAGATGTQVPQAQEVLASTGGTLTGGVDQIERTITAGAFDLSTGNFWTCGAISIPNPTNAVAGASGLIRVTAAPTAWGSNFSTPPAVTTVPAIIPFYVEGASQIRLGQAVGVA